MRAVVVDGDNAVRVDYHRDVPRLQDDRILVRPVAVALNPTDWRHVRGGRARDGCILGCDYAGVVEAVGSAVTKPWKPGDRVFGCGHGANLANPDDGVFAQVASLIGDLQMKIPDSLSFEEAATLGLGSITVGQGLYQKALKLQLPSRDGMLEKKDIAVLIYGGATATGALAIQFAKQSGYTVITTCSPRNFDYVRSLGADAVIDYHAADAGNQIRSLTDDQLEFAWDTVSVAQSAAICADALTTSPQRQPIYGTILPTRSPREDVETVSTVMYTAFGKDFKFGPVEMPASEDDFRFGKQFFQLVEDLVAQRRIRPHHLRVRDDGLEGLIQGLEDLEMGKVRAEKLVYVVN
ncbi:hypothetical protein NW754_014912 [Fusarium falciforme]|uniref:Enoyl reductase (ER) domain-containing protein n=1 Tax=Fusarium falciforme TaxID=195108 RepID=A0A9W8QX38_9HYPO|nr:hypothetical protein NW754_014912 [Fusarium falciforme]KAJ4178792.1 hypothetical protein NW755_012907 [Fusarium falciforme]KAJ4182266.1 hypothetical protein NW767_013949 [Fusarium falciforme]KAJ4238321.1 hypothetical protein NW757_013137 [Fusarium falciforme]